MKPLAPFTAHCLELLAPLGAVRARSMFGGVGLYVDDLFMALIADERLYLKVGAAHEAAFVAAGCAPFSYTTAQGVSHTMGYRLAPDEALESPSAMQPWARRALEAALMAANAKSAKAAKPTRKSTRAKARP
jgi:DNA transformation protein and related proteins